jgi:hypothetical protein
MRDLNPSGTHEEGVMWELRHKARILVSSMLASRRSPRRPDAGGSMDWLPPVIGPEDWSIAMMADRSSSWYFDRS